MNDQLNNAEERIKILEKERKVQEKKYEELKAQVGNVEEMKNQNKKMEKEMKEALKNYEIVE